MEDVVNQLGLNIQYYGHVYLRDVNCYKSNPIQITPLQAVTTPFSMSVVSKGSNDFVFKINDGEWKKAHFGNKVNTEFGPIAITKTQIYNDNYVGYTTKVQVNTVQNVAKALVANLKAEIPDKYGDIMQLSISCDNQQMATDVLNAVIAVYNQNEINSKNSIARSTEAFISDRIISLSKDLSGVDSQIAQLKVNSVNSAMFSDPTTSVKYLETANEADMQLSLASQVYSHINKMGNHELMPSNTGIHDAGVEGQIAKYNEAMLQYQKIASTSSQENPVMIELTNSLNSMKNTILRSLNGYIAQLRTKRSSAHAQEGRATGSMAAVPSQEKAITEVTRQQQIKEQLYLYLLNKREENALQLAITEPNAKIVEKPSDRGIIAPNEHKITAAGGVLGLCVPALVLFVLFWIRLLDTMIHTRHDVEDNCTIPIIGDLPSKSPDKKHDYIVVADNGHDRVTEACLLYTSDAADE